MEDKRSLKEILDDLEKDVYEFTIKWEEFSKSLQERKDK